MKKKPEPFRKRIKPIKDVTGRNICFASQKKLKKIYPEVIGFIKNIFGVSPVFISNKSSLYDFLGTNEDVETIEDVIDKVIKTYGIEINFIKEKPIVDIVNYIVKKIKGSLP